MSIQVLAPEVANQIAAGEVVERPASAVKELVENSLDAGATDVRVEIREGGRRLLRVQDDGCGIRAAETPLLFHRHATSKINSTADLDRLSTMGFRGEALASIGSVAQVSLLTAAAGEPAGTWVRVEGGIEVAREPRAATQGTTVTVEHLFANVPARLKFLKQAATEAGHIYQIVTRYALAFPERRFSLVSDGRLLFQSTGSGKRFDVLVKVYGLDMARQMLAVGAERGAGRGAERLAGREGDLTGDGDGPGAPDEGDPDDELLDVGDFDLHAGLPTAGPQRPRVTGYVGAPALHRSNRSYITLFVNRRWFQDTSLSYGVIQAYHTLLPVGRYPLAVLFIEIDPTEVDVNVHPTKAEVRFRDSHAVFGAVQSTVRRTLTEFAPIPQVTLPAGPEFGAARPDLPQQMGWDTWDSAEARAERREALLAAGHGELTPDPAAAAAAGAPVTTPPALMPLLRVVGQVAATYIVAEGPDGMYLIDQHAAHERVLYEQMLGQHAGAGIPVQTLLEPLVLELAPEQAGVVAENLAALVDLGLGIEPFGSSAYLVRSVPAVLSRDNPQAALAEIIDGLADRSDAVAGADEARLVRLICKRAAVKGGHVLSLPEMQELVRLLEACRAPRTCPHGRPTMITLSAGELARQFGRL